MKMPFAGTAPLLIAAAFLGVNACASGCFAQVVAAPATEGAPSVSAQGYRQLSLRRFGVSLGDVQDLCRLSEILISPDGRFGFLYEQPATSRRFASSTYAAVVDLACVRRHGWGVCQIDAVDALEALKPLGWTSDSQQLFVVEGHERLSALRVNKSGESLLKPEGNEAAIPRQLGFGIEPGSVPAEEATDVLAASLTANWRQALRAAPPDSIVWSSRLGSDHKLRLIFRDNRSLNLLLPGDHGYLDSNVRSEWVDSPRLVETADGRPAAAADGFMASVRNGAMSVEMLPWQGRAIVDAASGRVVGFHDETGILAGHSPGSADTRPIVIDESELVLRVQQAPDFQLIVVTDFNGLHRWILREPGQADVVTGCNRPAISRSSPAEWPVVEIRRGSLEITQSLAVPYHLYSERGREAEKLAVLFRGGPGQQEIYNTADLNLRELVMAGFDVLVPEYAGNTGAGPDYSARLRTEGAITALGRDVEAIGSSEILDRYDIVASIGESFGAVPAVLFESLSPVVDCTILTVPYLRYRDPATWTERSESGAFSPDYQYRFEASFFGEGVETPPEGFSLQLRRLVRSWRPRGAVHAVFGEGDVVSRAEDLDSVSPQITKHVVPGGHGFAAATPEGQAIVAAALQTCNGRRP